MKVEMCHVQPQKTSDVLQTSANFYSSDTPESQVASSKWSELRVSPARVACSGHNAVVNNYKSQNRTTSQQHPTKRCLIVGCKYENIQELRYNVIPHYKEQVA